MDLKSALSMISPMVSSYRTETDLSTCMSCICLESRYVEQTSVNNSGKNSTSDQKKAKNQRKTERHNLMTYCLVVSCLLLEVLVCVVVYCCVRNKCCKTSPEACKAENTENIVINPIYQPGSQRPQISKPIPAQEPYQPLVVDTRGPGASAEYRGLQAGLRDDPRIGVPVDQTDYQDLDQTEQTQKYQGLVAEGALEDREYGKGITLNLNMKEA
ncbi:hypothetical protein ACROYT_G032652 [Oculina patagonica]